MPSARFLGHDSPYSVYSVYSVWQSCEKNDFGEVFAGAGKGRLQMTLIWLPYHIL